MMNDKKIRISKRIKNYTLILLFIGITSIMLISIIPLVTVDSSVDLNMISMKGVQDTEMRNILEKMENINKLFWTSILLSLSCLIGVVINFYESNKYIFSLSKILIFFGIPILFINSAISLIFYQVIIGVIETKSISLAYIVNPAFRYSNMILILVLVLLAFSIFHFINLVKFFINRDKEDKNENKKIELIKIKDKGDIITKKDFIEGDKKIEITRWLSDEVSKLGSEEIGISNNIERKNGYNIRCPKCKHVFPVKNIEGIKKVICPKCGKEGVLEK